MPLPFVVYSDDELILMSLPSGFQINTPKVALFIDGSTHMVHRQPHQMNFASMEDQFANLKRMENS